MQFFNAVEVGKKVEEVRWGVVGVGGVSPLLFAVAVLRSASGVGSVRVRGSECYTIKRGGRRPFWCAASL